MTMLIADPFVQMGVLAVAGALVTLVLLRRHAAWRLLFQSVFFVALTVLLNQNAIIPYEVASGSSPVYERIFIAAAKIIWWLNAAWLLTAAARVFVIFERRPREGRLPRDLLVGITYLGATLSVVASSTHRSAR